MRVAITGGTGFIGSHVARAMPGKDLVLVARGRNPIDPQICELPRTRIVRTSVNDLRGLEDAFAKCELVIHCAGINREQGEQTYRNVHIEGTRNVIQAASKNGVGRLILISFLRARPDCGSAYHESKWAAEELVRASGMDYTVLKCGVIYGKDDHMLAHLSRAFFTFPFFALVGSVDKPIRPTAVEDLAGVISATALEGALSRKTAAVIGPETLSLRAAVERVARVVDRRPLMFPLPVRFHYCLAWLLERIMTVPMVSLAQVRILSEGLAEPSPPCELLPEQLAPQTPFTETQIRNGLPPAGPFGWGDLRCSHRHNLSKTHKTRVFFEMP